MANRPQQNPKHNARRFSDPLGEHMKSVNEAQDKRKASYPDVNKVFRCFYLDFEPTEKVGERFLGSSDGLVGSVLALRRLTKAQAAEMQNAGRQEQTHSNEYDQAAAADFEEQNTAAQNEQHTLGFYDYGGRLVASFNSFELSFALDKNWQIHCILAYSVFTTQEKSLKGTAACFCYDPTLNKKTAAALEAFINSTVQRMTARTYLKLTLSQEQFIKIIESDGVWTMLREEPWPRLPKGTVYYRRRRTLIERLIDVANRGNKGCLVASWIGTFVIIAAIVFAVWLVFFR